MAMIRTRFAPGRPVLPDLLGQMEDLLNQLATAPNPRTARLVRSSTAKKARKLVEEATEVALDAVAGDRNGLVSESVDLLYHLAVIWHDQEITATEIRAEMARRATILGIVEKRPKKGSAKKALRALEKSPPVHPPCAIYRKGDTIDRIRLSDLNGG